MTAVQKLLQATAVRNLPADDHSAETPLGLWDSFICARIVKESVATDLLKSIYGGVFMASVTFEHLTKTYPNGFVSVDDVDLHIEDGEFVVFHGPSGCGKSTILRMMGGLEDITSGNIYLGRDLLNDILPRDRHLAMAFQNYTLYRNFNAYDNIALGLRLRNLPRTVIDNRVKEAARFFGITDPFLRRTGRESLSAVPLCSAPTCFWWTRILPIRMRTDGGKCSAIFLRSTKRWELQSSM